MMNLEKRVEAFAALGYALEQISPSEFEGIAAACKGGNSWFDVASVQLALAGIKSYLNKEALSNWVAQYPALAEEKKPINVGLVLAGNIPAVGFHDMLSVLIAGNHLSVKYSSQDKFLPKYLLSELFQIAPEFKEYVTEVEQLKGVDAIIATGSDNSARYFEHYFGKYPNIIRHNRTSVGVLNGAETAEELAALGSDILTYYGLGCRNVSKIFIPEGYDIQVFLKAIDPISKVAGANHKYSNNYDYNKSIYLVNGVEHYDTGYLMLVEDENLVSPISVLFFERYQSTENLALQLDGLKDKIQCVVSSKGWWKDSFAFGQAQCPNLNDYADGVDTIKFLTELDLK